MLRYPAKLSALSVVLLGFFLLVFCCGIRSDAAPRLPMRMLNLPRLTIWAWERREDLHALPSRRVAVAYLDRTLLLGLNVYDRPRRDPLLFPSAAIRIPVVRIEPQPGAMLDTTLRTQAVQAILQSARQPGIAALQIDFDATRSQRTFYRALISDLRRQMPPNLPLSITALASWCSYDDWLRGLPIDEAVPMFFRMEPDRRRAPADLAAFRIREPLCQASIGISTTETWPPDLAGKRIYLFPDHGWRVDSIAAYERKLP